MPNEISVLVDMVMRNGNFYIPFQPGVVQIDQTNARPFNTPLTIGTTEEAVSFGDLTAPRVVMLWNQDTTNFVEWGLTGSYPAILRPNSHPTVFELGTGKTLYLKADTADCKVWVMAYDA